MNADRLLAHYEKISDTPDAIPSLRRFILDLAVRGKLVEQDPKDGNGSSLLVKVERAWAGRISSGKVKKQKVWESPGFSDVPFEVPNNWALVRLGQAVELVNGRAFKPSDWTPTGLPIVRIQNLNNPTASFNRYDGEVKDKFLIDTGDFLISWSGTPGTSFGAHVWERGPAVLNQHIFKSIIIGDAFEIPFLKLAINSRLLELIEQAHGGVGLQHITKPKLEAVVLTLPPRAEQHRIVAKVDELMALCDRLEAARTEREATRDRLAAASLARLNAPDPDPAVFQNHAGFALDSLSPLTTRPDQIKALRQTILNLAVRGKLVRQNPNDEPASELLKRIAAEKARLVKAGESRKPKIAPTLLGGNMPFSLPANWRWSQIAEIGVLSPRNDADDHAQSSFVPMPLIASEYGAAIEHEVRRWGEIKRGYTHFAEGDVGLAKITPCFENGKSAVFRHLTGGFGSGTTELHVVRPLFIDPDYILIFLKCPHFIETGISKMTGTAGQKRVPTKYFASSPFPLPPLAEQHRIVAKVNELMALCGWLEASLASGDYTRCRLLDALLHEALAPSEEKSGSIIPTIAQKAPDKPPGSPKVLTEPKPAGTSPA